LKGVSTEKRGCGFKGTAPDLDNQRRNPTLEGTAKIPKVFTVNFRQLQKMENTCDLHKAKSDGQFHC
jgi:hypothetical protein